MKRWKVVLPLLAAASAVLIYGDPRQAPVTHPEWARMVLRALDMEAILGRGASASLAFDSLSWRSSLGLPTDRPFRSTGVDFAPGPPRLARAQTASGELGYRIAAARGGDYRVRVRLLDGGAATTGLGLELTQEGAAKPTTSQTLTGGPACETGPVYLAPALYTLSLALPPGAALSGVEVIPPCVNSIEPPGGWHATAIAQTGDVAVTVLKALDAEYQLPPAAAPIELPSLAFQPVDGRALKVSLKGDLENFWLQADESGLRALASLNIGEPGLYSVSVFGLAGSGQALVADSCHKAVLCPSNDAAETPAWHTVLTAEFAAGRHSLALTLTNRAGVQRVRIERKKDSVADYLATLARLGLDLGAQRPIPRSQAVEAMNFIAAKRKSLHASCGDIALPGVAPEVAGLLISGGALPPTGGAPVPGPNPGIVPLPGSSPAASPSPAPSPTPASPTPSPAPSASPAPSPAPTASPAPLPSPSPSIGPPPPTSTQPPASVVKD